MLGQIEARLLGSAPTLTREEVEERAGITSAEATALWSALGFTEVPPGVPAFTDSDIEAIQLLGSLRRLGVLDEDEAALVRTMGRAFSRLSEWQLATMSEGLSLDELPPDDVGAAMDFVQPTIEKLMIYTWRRHAVAAARRMLLARDRGEAERSTLVVGFADIVGYTRRSRSMAADELTDLVEVFETNVQRIMTEHHGRVIKSIGDEVLFVTEDPRDAALIALALVGALDTVPGFPELRVGLARGPVLAHYGDVYGEVVNIAARLTSVARPGRICMGPDLAASLRPIAADEGLRVRRMRRTAVKGYRRLESWSLKRDKHSLQVEEADEVGDVGLGGESVDQVD